jgi:hypothetical protein
MIDSCHGDDATDDHRAQLLEDIGWEKLPASFGNMT